MKLYYMLIVSCLLFIQAGCQEQAEKSGTAKLSTGKSKIVKPDPGKPGPRVKFESAVYNFGEVGTETKNLGKFKFTNTGIKQLKIIKVAPCCGVVTKLENNKNEYEPGESGVINVEWNSGPLPSTMEKTIVLHSNDNSKPQLDLTIKAKVVQKVVCEPDRLRLFLDEENAGCPSIVIKSIDEKPFSVTEFVSTGDCITADLDTSLKASKHVIKPIVDMSKLTDNMKGRIDITMDHPEGKGTQILFDVLPKYSVSLPLIIVFNAEPDKAITRTFTVQNNYHKEFEIESSSSRDDTVKVLGQKKIKDGYQLEIEITPPTPAEGQIKYSDLLNINIKDGDKLVVPCNLYYSRAKIKMSK